MLEEWKNKIINDDCLNVLPSIPDKSIDCIICDLPYGTTAAEFDKFPIDLKQLWKEYERIIKPNRAIVLFAQQPFTTQLIASNISLWKYNWIWEKDNASNFLNSHFQPMKITEDICVFGNAPTSYTKCGEMLIYNPQFTEGRAYTCKSGSQRTDKACVRGDASAVEGFETVNEGIRYPKNLIKFNRDKDRFHPTQKPIALLEYLIKTYSNKGELILDNCSGSGSLAIACKRADRDFICIEKDKTYYDISLERLRKENMKKRLF